MSGRHHVMSSRSRPARVLLVLLFSGLLSVGLALVLPAAVGKVPSNQGPRTEVEELDQWARAMVSQGRRDQLSVRFGPLFDRWWGSGRQEEAVVILELWAGLDGDDLAVQSRIGWAQLELQRFEFAKRAFQRVVDSEAATASGLREGWLGIALTNWELGLLDPAEQAFSLALEGPEEANGPTELIRYQWGRFLLWSGRPARAFEVLRGLPAPGTGRPDILLMTAKACISALDEGALDQGALDLGALDEGDCDLSTAIELFATSVALLPGHPEARYGLIRALQRAGRTEEASAQAAIYRDLLAQDQAATRQAGLSEARAKKAERMLSQGDAESALAVLKSSGTEQSVEELVVEAKALRALGLGGLVPRAAGQQDSQSRSDEQCKKSVELLSRAAAAEPERRDVQALLSKWVLEGCG